jgi:hypothetical protein
MITLRLGDQLIACYDRPWEQLRAIRPELSERDILVLIAAALRNATLRRIPISRDGRIVTFDAAILLAVISCAAAPEPDAFAELARWGKDQQHRTGKYPTRPQYWKRCHQLRLCKHGVFMDVIRPELNEAGLMRLRGNEKPKK